MSAKSYYPAFLNISGHKCVVFGGGHVALRKVKMLLEFGAHVQVVAPELCDELDELYATGSINACARRFDPGDLDGAFVAIAATDEHSTNERIASEARRRRVLVNVVDVPMLCDFIVPSYLRKGDLTIAVSTSGSSPALAKKIRSRLETEFGEEYSTLSRLVGEIRSEFKQDGIRISASTWRSALNLDAVLDLLRQGKEEEAKTALIDALNQCRGASRYAR